MNNFDSILEKLNPEQRAAVTTTEGPLLVIAGAGSGKTRVITHRIAYLVRERNVPPWAVFAATFTNKAAEEMRHRIGAMLPGIETARLTVSTFHSICVSILRREAPHAGLTHKFTIADDTDQLALVKSCLKELDIPLARIKPEEARNWIAKAKLLMADPAAVRDAIFSANPEERPHALYSLAEVRRQLSQELAAELSDLYQMYETRLQQSNALDFDDLILKVVRIFQSEPSVLADYHDRWRYFLVDEYQDTNRAQCELIRLLASRSRNLCVVGDEDQCIYSWRGAEIKNILNFPKKYEGTQVVRLEQNYRSTRTILRAAESVIKHNRQRHEKRLRSEQGEGEPVSVIEAMDERDEAAQVVDAIRRLGALGVPYRDMAVFYRVNALSRLFEDFLRESRIPYRVIGGVRFYDRAEIKDLLAYLRLVINPADGMSLSRIINKPARGIGEKALTKLFTDSTLHRRSFFEQLVAAAQDESTPRKTRAGMTLLLSQMASWRELNENRSPAEVLDAILRDTQYEASLGDPNSLDAMSRMENIGALRQALEDYHQNNPTGSLDGYLEMVTLTSAADELTADSDCVALLTLHSAKGLEFPVVFMTGLEEGIFPSSRSLSESGNLEEERRLFYVGVTRARERLILSRADGRALYGRRQYLPPSSFWHEVPQELTQSIHKAIKSWRSAPSLTTTPRGGGRTRLPLAADSGAMHEANPPNETDEPMLFPPGSRIRHPNLGEGEVLAVKGSGDKRKLAIRFDAGMQLELLERYGGLEIAGELPF